MKKFIALTLTVVMIAFILTACGDKIAPTSQTEPEATPVTKPVSAQELISLREQGTIPGSVDARYMLPKLNMDSPAAKEFDEWVDKAFADWKSNLNRFAEDQRTQLNYAVGIYNDILAVEFLVNGEDASFESCPEKFSLDLRTNEALTVEGLLERAGATREQLEKYIRADQQVAFDWEDSEYGEIENIAAFREKMLSSENLKDITVHLSPRLEGVVQIGIPHPFYIDANRDSAVAREYLAPLECYTYIRDLTDLCNIPVTEAENMDAGASEAENGFDAIRSEIAEACKITDYDSNPSHYDELYSDLGPGIVWMLTHRDDGVHTLNVLAVEFDIDDDGEDELCVARAVTPQHNVNVFAIYDPTPDGIDPIFGDAVFSYLEPFEYGELPVDWMAWEFLTL